MDKKVLDLLNRQVGHEKANELLYRSMGSCLYRSGYENVSNWMFKNAEDEKGHCDKIIAFMNLCNCEVRIPDLDAPQPSFEGLEDIGKKVLAREKETTKMIYEIFASARDKDEYAVEEFLHWFVAEQVEEEDKAMQFIDDVKHLGDHIELCERYIVA